MRYVVLTLTEQEAQSLEEVVTDADWYAAKDYRAFQRARKKLREGRKQFGIEKRKRSADEVS